MTIYRFELPIKLLSEANNTDHWTKKRKRKLIQKNYIDLYCKNDITKISLPCSVSLIRYAPRQFDDDNLIISFKSIRDHIAQILIPNTKPGQADGDKRIKWLYNQIKSKTIGVIIEIEEVKYVKSQSSSEEYN